MEILANIEILIQLFVALLLGALLGMEREIRNKPAGVKTHALVSLGAALFIIIGYYTFYEFQGSEISFDPSRVLAAIVVGVGFIGGGLILKRQFEVEGLTTAAGLWIAAAVGAAIGVGLYLSALFAVLATLFVFHAITSFENRYIRKDKGNEKP